MTVRHSHALETWLAGVLGKPFTWGLLDCNTLALDWASALTGRDVVGEVVGRYDSEQGARDFTVTLGRNLLDLLGDAGGVVLDGHGEAGDVALVRDRGEPWWRGHILVNDWSFVSVWPKRGVSLAPRTMLRECSAVFVRFLPEGVA